MTTQPPQQRSIRDFEADQANTQQLIDERKSQQSLVMGILGGVVMAIVGAIGWGVIVGITHIQIGFIAVGVGFLVGFGVRFFGRGVDMSFGIVGAVLSGLAIVAGNLLAVAILASNDLGIPLGQVLQVLTKPGVAGKIMQDSFSVLDLLFYAIAIYEGFRFSYSSGRVRRPRA